MIFNFSNTLFEHRTLPSVSSIFSTSRTLILVMLFPIPQSHKRNNHEHNYQSAFQSVTKFLKFFTVIATTNFNSLVDFVGVKINPTYYEKFITKNNNLLCLLMLIDHCFFYYDGLCCCHAQSIDWNQIYDICMLKVNCR